MNIKFPDLPSLEFFTSDRLDYFFKIWEVLKFERKNPIVSYDGTTYAEDEDNKTSISLYSNLLNIDKNTTDLAISERNTTDKFFKAVIDQPAFNSRDHVRLRRLLVDWYTANKTLISKSKRSVDPYSLSGDELDELILGFGFPYPYDIDKDNKAVFLHTLINYYKHKGSPKVLDDVLSFFGLTDVVLSEWWLKSQNDRFWMVSKPAFPREYRNDPNYILTIPYNEFVEPDPYWILDKPSEETLQSLYNQNQITLPSITPYISLNSTVSDKKFKVDFSIMWRKLQEDYEWWVRYVLNWIGEYSTFDDLPTTANENDAATITSDNYDCVYNGTEWINLECNLPDSWLKNNPICGDSTVFNSDRDIYLNCLDGSSASLFESMIGAEFLLNCKYGYTNDTTGLIIASDEYLTMLDSSGLVRENIIYYEPEYKESLNFSKNILMYNGTYIPLYSDSTQTDDSTGIHPAYCKDCTSNVDFDNIRTEYNNVLSRIIKPIIDNDTIVGINGLEQYTYESMRQQRNEKLEQEVSKFYTYCEYDTTSVMWPMLHPEKFLNATNPYLYQVICSELFEYSLLYSDDKTRLSRFSEIYFKDISYYLKNTLNLPSLISIPTLTIGLSLYYKIKEVIDFFKPYRARFKDYITEYTIDNPVDDCVALEDWCSWTELTQTNNDYQYTHDAIYTDIIQYFNEHLFANFFEINIEDVVLQEIQTIVSDQILVFDSISFEENIRTDVDQNGPYSFETLRVTDTLEDDDFQSSVISTFETDYFGERVFDLNLLEHINQTINLTFIDDVFSNITDSFDYSDIGGIFVEDSSFGVTEEYPFESALVADGGYIDILDSTGGLIDTIIF